MNSFYFHNTRGRTIGQSQKQVKRGSPGAQSGSMVPGGRVELPLSCENRILSPARLPVPPSGHTHVLSPEDVFLACHRQRVNRQLPPSLLPSRSKQIPALRVYIAAFHARPLQE